MTTIPELQVIVDNDSGQYSDLEIALKLADHAGWTAVDQYKELYEGEHSSEEVDELLNVLTEHGADSGMIYGQLPETYCYAVGSEDSWRLYGDSDSDIEQLCGLLDHRVIVDICNRYGIDPAIELMDSHIYSYVPYGWTPDNLSEHEYAIQEAGREFIERIYGDLTHESNGDLAQDVFPYIDYLALGKDMVEMERVIEVQWCDGNGGVSEYHYFNNSVNVPGWDNQG